MASKLLLYISKVLAKGIKPERKRLTNVEAYLGGGRQERTRIPDDVTGAWRRCPDRRDVTLAGHGGNCTENRSRLAGGADLPAIHQNFNGAFDEKKQKTAPLPLFDDILPGVESPHLVA